MSHHGVTCPYCKSTNVDAEFVDVEVGYVQVTPYTCGDCLAFQLHPYQENENATEEEHRVGWWRGPSQ